MVKREVIDHLKPGAFYLFDHRIKGPFTARLVEVIEQVEDAADPVVLLVEIETGPGSGQERLANAVEYYAGGGKGSQAITTKQIRPSHLVGINSPNTKEKERLLQSFIDAKERHRPLPIYEGGEEAAIPMPEKKKWWRF